MKPIPKYSFRHQYHKLSGEVFTTIRGKAQLKRLTVGQVIDCEAPTGDFKATVLAAELRRVDQMTVEFLKADAEYPGGAPINSLADFVTLVNSFRAPFWTQVTLATKMTVITLKKVS